MMIRDLSWLSSLADHEHVTEAASALGVTQPTLSRALARMEAELGVRLFGRAADGVHPTPTGTLVVEAARDVVARYDQLLDDLASALDPDAGVVRLAFLDSIASSLVPQVLRSFHEAAPRVRVLLTQEPGHDIVADLSTGAADVAITSAHPPGPYAWHPLQEERLVLVVPHRHRLRERRRVRLADLGDEELVTVPLGFGYRTFLDDLLRAAGIAPPISFESQDLATIEGLVAAGLGVAILPETIAGASGTIGIPIASRAARRTIGLTWRTDRPLPAPAGRFRDHVLMP